MEDLIVSFKSIPIMSYSPVILKSGNLSSVYLDFKKLISFPQLFPKIYSLLPESIFDVDLVCGIALGGTALAHYISFTRSIPQLYLRDQSKEYGLKNQIEGIYQHGQRVLLVEDVVTTGQSIRDKIGILLNHGLLPTSILVIMNRSNLTLELPIHSILSLSDLIHPTELLIRDRIKYKKSNLIISADVPNFDQLVNIINLLGSKVLGFKLHSDIISDFNPLIINQLREKYSLIIIEDRKLADISHITRQQIQSFKHSFDAITCHAIAGLDSLRQISDFPLLIISQLSTQGNLINDNYTLQAIDIARRINAVGLISQTKVKGMLTLTPGINKSQNKNQDQVYSNYSSTDIQIVGRGILHAEDMLLALEQYQSSNTETD